MQKLKKKEKETETSVHSWPKNMMLQSLVNCTTILTKREVELMDPIKAKKTKKKSLVSWQHKQSKVNRMIPQVSPTSTQFKETSIQDVSSQLMKVQTINIQDATTDLYQVVMLIKLFIYEFHTQKCCLGQTDRQIIFDWHCLVFTTETKYNSIFQLIFHMITQRSPIFFSCHGPLQTIACQVDNKNKCSHSF